MLDRLLDMLQAGPAQSGARLRQQRLRAPKLRIRGALRLADFPVPAQADSQLLRRGFEGLHRLDAIPLVIMVRRRQQSVSLPQHSGLRAGIEDRSLRNGGWRYDNATLRLWFAG